ncbi:MAG TPA: peroxidase family protein [Candidatus Acidoferrum sp.]|nr:peroxidase family protein [Candidatus Acidoferrum sp.]
MTAHGGGIPKSGLLPVDSGFRNFLGIAGGVVPFKVAGEEPHKDIERLRELMRRLSRRMATGVDGTAARDNGQIPSGYTYLLQFLAHDLVATSIPFWALDDASLGIRNERTSRLQLDTLYGGGPSFNPSIYAPDDKANSSRTMFRMGCIEKVPATSGACPFRDIARAAVTGTKGIALEGLSEALVADPRNDDHVIISQFTALFHALHNAIVETLPEAPTVLAAHKRFACARDATTLIYRHIVRNELLPLILHDTVRKHYDSGDSSERFFDADFAKDPSGPLPLEFSHGAFRFGHAMIRDEYQINERSFTIPQLMKQTSSRNPDRMPLNAAWIVNWSRFFPLDAGHPPNLSRLIGPTVSPLLMDSQLFGPIDDTNWHGLPYRDLMSAALAGVWSVPRLIDKVRPKLDERVEKAAAFEVESGTPTWKKKLKEWLEKASAATGLDGKDIETLVEDPPLPLFVLFEASIEGLDEKSKGTKLGVLGSLIVGDVLYALLEDGGPLAVKAGTALATGLAQISEQIYGKNELGGDVSTITSMEKLIKFVAKQNKWEAAQPPFI